MTEDPAIGWVGARSARNLPRKRRQLAKLREQTRTLREATDSQVNKHRNFLRIDRPEELLARPAELLPGQEWGLWLFDDALYEHIAVIGVRNGIVVAQTEDRQLLAVEQAQLLSRGHFLGWVR
jgi:hypothetical protein